MVNKMLLDIKVYDIHGKVLVYVTFYYCFHPVVDTLVTAPVVNSSHSSEGAAAQLNISKLYFTHFSVILWCKLHSVYSDNLPNCV